MPADAAWETVLRVAREGEPLFFFDGAPAEARTSVERELRAWSFVAARPSAAVCVRGDEAWRREGVEPWTRAPRDASPWDLVRSLAPQAEDARASPFPYGVAGLASYDAGRLVERMPSVAKDDTGLPWLLFFRFDAVYAVTPGGDVALHHAPDAQGEAVARELEAREPMPDLAREDGAIEPVRAELPQKRFEEMVVRAQEHVRAGDVFQVNLSHRLATRTTLSPLALYARLREANPAPFSTYMASGALPWSDAGFHVLSSSPERLFRLRAGRLEARPIAGTRRRGVTDAEDESLVAELRADAKERAEHVMLVDLARNDLGRVAAYGSVRVPRLLTVETYRTVHHLVSVVEADLAERRDAVDALRALFPGGTITGAPKVRAMELIEEIEPIRRGVYTGSIGWIAPDGDCDFNILIRTLLQQEGRVHLQVGAGIVEESEPEREYQETLAKAKGMLRALGADA